MEAGHIGMVGNLSNLNFIELPDNAFHDRLCLAHKSIGDVCYFSAFYGVCCLATIAKNLL